jgi:hypothetical protein
MHYVTYIHVITGSNSYLHLGLHDIQHYTVLGEHGDVTEELLPEELSCIAHWAILQLVLGSRLPCLAR